MSQLMRRVQETADRMADADGSRWHRVIVPRAAVIARGVFYTDGPICLVAYDGAGAYLGTVREGDAQRMAGHPNSRPPAARPAPYEPHTWTRAHAS